MTHFTSNINTVANYLVRNITVDYSRYSSYAIQRIERQEAAQFQTLSTIVTRIAEANLGLASDIAKTVLKYKRCSAKQAWVMAKAIIGDLDFYLATDDELTIEYYKNEGIEVEIEEEEEEEEEEEVAEEVIEEATEEEVEAIEAIETFVESDEEATEYLAKTYGEVRKGWTWGYLHAGKHLVSVHGGLCDCGEDCAVYEVLDDHNRTVENVKVCHVCSKY